MAKASHTTHLKQHKVHGQATQTMADMTVKPIWNGIVKIYSKND
jgi:hypothetical protein